MNPHEFPPEIPKPEEEVGKKKMTPLTPEEAARGEEWLKSVEGESSEEAQQKLYEFEEAIAILRTTVIAGKCLEDWPEVEAAVSGINTEELEQKLQEFVDLKLTAFETTHPIAELYSVTDLDYKDVDAHPEKYPVRVAARRDLFLIVAVLKYLKEISNISPEKYDDLEAHYKYLSRAVGIINGITGKVDHTR